MNKLLNWVVSDKDGFELLRQIDEDLSDQCRNANCPTCNAPLDRASYGRKMFGVAQALWAIEAIFYSLCCRGMNGGRRHRIRPPSVRFLDRKRYLAPLVLLIMIIKDGGTVRRLKDFEARLGPNIRISRATIKRWRKFWRETFPKSRFWQAALGAFQAPVPEAAAMPATLLDRFNGPTPQEQLLQCLGFLAPFGRHA
jgi:hypothetical protein